jgi:thymidylate synthase
MYQFYVDTKNKKLNLQIYIRSSDFFLANNWNTCTGSFLVYMICNLKDIDLTPGELSVITGDTHIYLSHVEAVKENLKRTPKPFPKLSINNEKEKLEDYTWEDFKLIGYSPMPNISAPMAV